MLQFNLHHQDDEEEEDAGDEEAADDDFGDFEGGGNGAAPEGVAAGRESLATLVQEELPSLSKHWLAGLKERFVDELLHWAFIFRYQSSQYKQFTNKISVGCTDIIF